MAVTALGTLLHQSILSGIGGEAGREMQALLICYSLVKGKESCEGTRQRKTRSDALHVLSIGPSMVLL